MNGAVILVTGASTGIGLSTAQLLAARGARLFLAARRQPELDAALEDIRSAGGTAEALVTDVSDQASIEAAVDAAETAFGPLDGLFLNAGSGGSFAPIGGYGLDTFEAVVRTNLHGSFWAMRRVLPGMIERGRGSILVTGSLASHRGMANNAAYVASKHAVLGLARAAAIEAAPHGVRVNCVIPGFIETPMMGAIDDGIRTMLSGNIPQNRLGGPEEVAEVAAFLLSDAASHVTGQSWSVDGGVLGTLAVG